MYVQNVTLNTKVDYLKTYRLNFNLIYFTLCGVGKEELIALVYHVWKWSLIISDLGAAHVACLSFLLAYINGGSIKQEKAANKILKS